MTTILEALAAGRIDAAEAARRIDALKASSSADDATADSPDSEATREPTNEELAAQQQEPQDAWAAATDRPQQATYTTESFAPADSSSTPRDEETVADESAEEATEQEPAAKGGGPKKSGGVERLSVRAVGRRVRIIGVPSVATVSADGPHVLRRNGSVLEVSSDGEVGSSMDGFTLLKAPRSLDDFRSLGLGKELLLRVNPDIAVDVEVTAGSLNTERVPHLGKVRVTAGGAKLLDVEEITDALIQAGSATVKGSIKTGRSRIRAESGSLSVQLADDSNVTVKGEAQLGKVNWSGGHSGAGDEVVMGNGSARLDVEVVMGHASVRVGSEADGQDDE